MKTSREFIIDANVLFSAFISGKEIYSLLFSEHGIYLPDFAFLELDKYKKRILKKTKLTENQFREFILGLLKYVTVVPNLLLSETSLVAAYQICREIDEKDTVYVAAAIQLDLTLVTNDKRLYAGLKQNNFPRVMLLGDVINSFPQMKK
jgi:predicted nucleic acid-binding protein